MCSSEPTLGKGKKLQAERKKGSRGTLCYRFTSFEEISFASMILRVEHGHGLMAIYVQCPFRPEAGPVERLGRFPPETYESNCFHHDFEQFGKQCSWYKAILSSIVLSQQCCAVCFIPFTVAEPIWDLTSKYHWNRTLTLLAGSAPAFNKSVETVATP